MTTGSGWEGAIPSPWDISVHWKDPFSLKPAPTTPTSIRQWLGQQPSLNSHLLLKINGLSFTALDWEQSNCRYIHSFIRFYELILPRKWTGNQYTMQQFTINNISSESGLSTNCFAWFVSGREGYTSSGHRKAIILAFPLSLQSQALY